ncbi:MAG TPA: NmrA family NAD(P)-binding protein [Polyangiaceae bacterium]|nr:NmrA family NAD(P)-binding protein [Polyangiaceae bacterium]
MTAAEGAKRIAVVGASGAQGAGVVGALKARPGFAVRAITRKPSAYRGPADEVVEADLTKPETLGRAFEGADGVFVVTNFWEKSGASEQEQARAAVRAAAAAGVRHFVWSTLPDVHAISGGRFEVPHFTGKAEVDADVAAAGFPAYTFVEAPFYFQNLTGAMAPQTRPDGTKVWGLPLDPAARCIHVGDIADLGKVVAGAFERPDQVGRGQHLALAAALTSFDEIVATLRAQGHKVGFEQVPDEVFATFFPGAEEMVAMCRYWQQYTYFGPDAEAKIALARAVATGPFVLFADWARQAMPVATGA